MNLDPQKPPPWRSPGFLPMLLVMMVASGLIVARGRGGPREVVFGERNEKKGLGDVPFRPRVAPSVSASASVAPSSPPASAAPSASASGAGG